MKSIRGWLALILAAGMTLLPACDLLPSDSSNGGSDNINSSNSVSSDRDDDSSNRSDSDALPFYSYRKSEDGTYYIFEGAANCTYVEIEAELDGLPVKEIASSAFPADTWGVFIPSSVDTIAADAFENCASLREIQVAEENETFSVQNNDLYSKDGKTLIKYAGGKTDVAFTIPSAVTSLADYAFAYSDALTEVHFHEGVETIGKKPFEQTTLKTLGVSAELLEYLPSKDIEHLTITSGEVLSYAFSGKAALRSLVLKEGVESVGAQAFAYCNKLATVEIADSVTDIADDAFESCPSIVRATVNYAVLPKLPKGQLTSVKLTGEGILRGDTFQRASALLKAEICEGITELKYGAFNIMDNLETVILPLSLQTLNEAFPRCPNIKYVYYKGSKEQWAKVAVGAGNELVTSHLYYYSEEEPTDTGAYWHYDANGEPAIWNV